jgi:hypothetical protein
VYARDFGFNEVDSEVVFMEKCSGDVVHFPESFYIVADDGCVIAVASGGDLGRGVKRIASSLAVVAVEFVHDEYKEEGGKGASLFYSSAELNFRSDSVR